VPSLEAVVDAAPREDVRECEWCCASILRRARVCYVCRRDVAATPAPEVAPLATWQARLRHVVGLAFNTSRAVQKPSVNGGERR
jgi:hypothetical protein